MIRAVRNATLACRFPLQIEVESGSELTEPFLMEEFHPTKSLNRSKFAKPAPPNRGNRRMTKVPSK